MITRRKFGEKLMTCLAAGSLANFALVAAPMSEKDMFVGVCRQGKDACATGGKHGDSCGNSGGRGQDQCRAPAPDAVPPVPVCKADTCSQSDKPTGNE